ncbi:KH domain-containing protein [Candidatus Peregrinibacteria bacterium]|nr:KH domain-containing protein [Candidatus Peregrinibacteria bacterium]
MEIEKVIQEILEQLLIKLEAPYEKVTVDKETALDSDIYKLNIEAEDPSMLIGFHGETIHALQHLLKIIAWKKTNSEFNIVLDVDNYKKRQEDNVLNLAKRKVDMARKTRKTQILPPMSGYFRRLVHLYLANPEFEDLKTESIGDGDHRQVTIVNKN